MKTMIVTKMQSITKMKMRVSLDGEPAFVASPAQIRLWGLYEGKELDPEQESTLQHQIYLYAARTAAETLARREYSAHELEQKLRSREFTSEAIRYALDYVRQKHYQDDERCAEAYIRSHSHKKSRLQMRACLREKGISDDVIEIALNEYCPDDSDILVADLNKRFGPDGLIPSPGDLAYQKLIQSYQRKGFRFSDIREAFTKYSKPSDDL